MNHEIEFLIIPLTKNDNKVVEEINLPVITATANIYCCSLTTICKLLQHDNLPIQNRRIAITNILDFLKWADTRINLQKHTTTKNKTTLTIYWKEFENYFSRDRYLQYITLLKELKVMSLVPYNDNQYSKKGERSNLYRFYNNYVGADTCIVITPNKTHSTLDVTGKHSKKITNTIMNIEVDYKSAIIAEIDYYRNGHIDTNQLRIRLNKLFSLNGKRFIKYGNKVNRVYHSLSNLSKISREFLHIRGVKFNNIDIVNCQPLLLCYYLIKNNLPVDANYITDCETGFFYERFYEKTGNDDVDNIRRKETKQQLYKSIFFDFKPGNLHNKQFCSLYPSTYQSLAQIALKEETLASILQNTEAEIFNDLLPVNSKYYFTLFDAIYFTDIADLISLMNEIKSKFLQLNLKASLSINNYGEEEFFEV